MDEICCNSALFGFFSRDKFEYKFQFSSANILLYLVAQIKKDADTQCLLRSDCWLG